MSKSIRFNQFVIFPLACFFLFSAASVEDCKVNQFKKDADKLESSKIESVIQLKNLYHQAADKLSPRCKSRLFGEFRSYYYQFMQSYEKSIEHSLYEYPMPKKKEKALKEKLSKVGWQLGESEGTYYIGENGAWFLNEFGKVLPGDWKKFLKQRKEEVEKKFSEDAELLISWKELRSRIIYWENFLRAYPAFQEKSTADYYLRIYLHTYLTGMDNSRIYDFMTKKVDREVKESYEKFLELNKKSKYYKIVNGQYNILEKNAFIISEKAFGELSAFHKKNGIESMLSVQPPTY